MDCLGGLSSRRDSERGIAREWVDWGVSRHGLGDESGQSAAAGAHNTGVADALTGFHTEGFGLVVSGDTAGTFCHDLGNSDRFSPKEGNPGVVRPMRSRNRSR